MPRVGPGAVSKWVNVALSKWGTNLWSAETRIRPVRFQAGCRRGRLNLASVFLSLFYIVVAHLLWLMNVCFCCYRFCFSILSEEIGLADVSEMTYFVSWDVKPQLNQSIKPAKQPLSTEAILKFDPICIPGVTKVTKTSGRCGDNTLQDFSDRKVQIPLKMICNDFLVVKVNCWSNVFNIIKSIRILRNIKL